MLAFGLASVPFFNGLFEQWTEISVNLPQVESSSPIYVQPKSVSEMPNYFDRECFLQPTCSKPDSVIPADPNIYTVNFCDVFREPKRYNGKIIRIKAFYNQGIDTSSLSDSSCKEWMRLYSHSVYEKEGAEAFNRIRKVMDFNQSNRTRIDVIGLYTDDIVDPDTNQNGYHIHLFEVIELKSAKPAKLSRKRL